ncbi:hypothetical protein RUM44_003063 [Polyplax serrata]|uniref:Uncharacterized protein n=1 Tax=Polyplax serrata TaxID=468196 RepID=A0ABR1AXE8_POLSC
MDNYGRIKACQMDETTKSDVFGRSQLIKNIPAQVRCNGSERKLLKMKYHEMGTSNRLDQVQKNQEAVVRKSAGQMASMCLMGGHKEKSKDVSRCNQYAETKGGICENRIETVESRVFQKKK